MSDTTKLEFVKQMSGMLYITCEAAQDLEKKLTNVEKELITKKMEFHKVTEELSQEMTKLRDAYSIVSRDFQERGVILHEKNKIIDELNAKLGSMTEHEPKDASVVLNGRRKMFEGLLNKAVPYEKLCELAEVPLESMIVVRYSDGTRLTVTPGFSLMIQNNMVIGAVVTGAA